MKKTYRKTLQLGLGTLVAQLVTLGSIPIITRVYVPETYGLLAVLILASSAIVPLVTLKVDTLIFTISSKEEVANLLSITRNFILLTSFCASTIVFAILLVLNNLSFASSLKFSFFFLGIVLLQGSILLLVQINLYAKKYLNISKSSLYQNLGISISQIGLGLIRPSIVSLVFGFAIGKIIGMIPLLKEAHSTFDLLKRFSPGGFGKMKEVFSKTKKIIFGNVFELAQLFIPTFFIGSFFGAQYSGYTAVVVTILGVPSTFMGGAIASVLLAEYSSMKSSESFKQLRKYLMPFILLSFIYAIILLIFGKELFQITLGESWEKSANLVTFLAVPFAINIFWPPLGSLILKTKNFDLYLKLNAWKFVASSLALLLSYTLDFSWILIIFSFYLASAFVQIIGILIIISSYLSAKNRFTKNFRK
jgi:O-antigen/teichoic acid export membrane protein